MDSISSGSPVSNYQNGCGVVVHSSASEEADEQTKQQVSIHIVDRVVSPALAMATPAHSSQRAMADKRRLEILNHHICHKIVLEFLNGEMALTLTCKHFQSDREKVSSYLCRYEKLCASGTPPEYDPFRRLIQMKIPGRLKQQELWKRLWIAREAGFEPWKRTRYIYRRRFDGALDLYNEQSVFSAPSSVTNLHEKLAFTRELFQNTCPGRDLRVHNDGSSKNFVILSIHEKYGVVGKRVSDICSIHSYETRWDWLPEKGIIGVMDRSNNFFVWEPDLDGLLPAPAPPPAVV